MAHSKKTATSFKVGLAAIAAVGLTLTGLSPAVGATINVGASDVQPTEIGGASSTPGYNYDMWHMGQVTGTGAGEIAMGEASFDFDNPAGITLHPKSETGTTKSTQLFKGYNIDDIEATPPMTAAEFEAFLNGVSVNVVSGTVNLQIAGEISIGGDPPTWTTLRPAAPHGSAAATDPALGNWIGTGSHSDNVPIATILEWLEGDGSFQLYGVGVVTETTAVVESITFGGDTYNFAVDTSQPTPPELVDTAAK